MAKDFICGASLDEDKAGATYDYLGYTYQAGREETNNRRVDCLNDLLLDLKMRPEIRVGSPLGFSLNSPLIFSKQICWACFSPAISQP